MAAFWVQVILNFRGFALVRFLVLLILIESTSYAAESDVNCLKSIKASLEDPLNFITSSWNFNNNSEGYVCDFSGVECWHTGENKILNINLNGMGLKGEFPRGIAACSSLTGLDLSRNKIYGSIPENISKLITYVTRLELSYNQLSGEIPEDLANCSYLNILKLDSNQLTGQIPPSMGFLNRIKTFNVMNNHLHGQVPIFVNATIPAESYANNAGLCGGPLRSCQSISDKSRTPAVISAAVGGLILSVLCVGVAMFLFLRRRSRSMKMKKGDPLGNKWAKNFKGTKRMKLSMFYETHSKMNLGDLVKATEDFSKNNIINSGRTGTMYKALLEDGTSLIVKRLHHTQHSDKEFRSEMTTLGSIKHDNLVPLLGFCLAKNERLLVYKNMPNGTLHDNLHTLSDGCKPMDWLSRLKVGIKAAKGFAWLHHSCNPRILHRNISSKCILLDTDYEPKISDFGLARLMNPVDTHLSTFVNGEFGELGYVAPEYSRTLMATQKGDVFSFGVVLLELVTGEMPTSVARAPDQFKGNLVEWVTHLSSISKVQEAFDASLIGKGHNTELLQFLKVACSCVVAGPKERPFMMEVYQLLRAVGQQYDFSAGNDLGLLSEVGVVDQLVELIVANDRR